MRIAGLDAPLFSDEIHLKEKTIENIQHIVHKSPPLSTEILKMFGPDTVHLRLFSLICNILTLFIIYNLSKKIYNKKTLFFSFFLYVFSFYSILSSLIITDEPLLIFLFTLCFFFYLKYEKTKSRLSYILSGIVLGLILLTKYTGILVFIILSLYKLITSRNLLKTIINLSPIFIIALIIFSIFPIMDYNLFLFTLNNLFRSTTGETISILSKLVILILWTTPLLLGLALLSLFKIEKKDLLFWIWIIIVLSFNLFIMPRGGFSEYFMILLPPLIILSSKYLSTIKLDKKYIPLGFISFIIFYITFIILNLNSRIMFPHIIGNYFNAVKHLNFNFMLPYAINASSWFGVSFLAILFMLILSFFFFFILILFKQYRKIALILFISLGLSYNLFLDGEYLLHLSQPDIDKIIYEMVDYTKENNLKYPVYTTNKAISDQIYDYKLYPDRIKIMQYRIDDKTIDYFSDNLSKEGGTIVFLDFTAKIKKEDLDKIENCNLIKTFSDKGQTLGYIYECFMNVKTDIQTTS